MIAFKNIQKHQHIIVYFVIAIVFPCLILGILAFRGIRNDQALIEKQHRKLAEQKAADVNGYILDVSNGITDAFSHLINQLEPPVNSFFQDSIIQTFVTQDPLVASVFYISRERLCMLKSSFLYMPGNIPVIEEKIVLDIDQNLAWHYEFRQKDFKKAIQLYQEALDNDYQSEQNAIALNAMARLQKKLKNNEEASKLYQQIARVHPEVHIDSKVPLGLAAQLELTLLFIEDPRLGDPYAALHNLFNDLLYKKWSLSQSTYDFFSHQIQQLDRSLREHNPSNELLAKMDALTNVEEILYASTTRLNDFRKNVVTRLDEWADERDPIDLKHIVLNAHSDDFSHGLVADGDQGFWGTLTNKESLLYSKLIPFLIVQNTEKSWAWNIQDEKGEFLLPITPSNDDVDHLKFSLPDHWQKYTLIAHAQPESLFKIFLLNDQGIYFFMFLIIAIILVAGIALIIYLINRELQMNELKANFIATVSHEFKSPLTAIQQMAEMFQNDRVPEKKKDKYYQVMMQEGERLSHLVDNILDMARIEQGAKRFDFKPSNMKGILQKTVDQYKQRYLERGIRFNLSMDDDLPQVSMDEYAIQQVLNNLLDNSIKYSAGSKEIDLNASQQNGSLSVSIKDRGIGMNKKDLSKIFDRFYRVKSSQTSGIKGSGIGLSLVKKIIEAHRGKIRVKSKPELGSTFIFYLPIQKNNDS